MCRRLWHSLCPEYIIGERRLSTQRPLLVFVLADGVEIVFHHITQRFVLRNIGNALFIQLPLEVGQLGIALGAGAGTITFMATLGGCMDSLYIIWM